MNESELLKAVKEHFESLDPAPDKFEVTESCKDQVYVDLTYGNKVFELIIEEDPIVSECLAIDDDGSYYDLCGDFYRYLFFEAVDGHYAEVKDD